MKRTLVAAGLMALTALVGCKKSEPGGGAGNDTFRVVVPALTTEVKQGELETLKVSIERSASFQRPVKLEFKAPAGITVDPDSTTVQPGDKGDVQVKLTAATDAPLGESKVLVKGTPDQGAPATQEFTIKVSAK